MPTEFGELYDQILPMYQRAPVTPARPSRSSGGSVSRSGSQARSRQNPDRVIPAQMMRVPGLGYWIDPRMTVNQGGESSRSSASGQRSSHSSFGGTPAQPGAERSALEAALRQRSGDLSRQQEKERMDWVKSIDKRDNSPEAKREQFLMRILGNNPGMDVDTARDLVNEAIKLPPPPAPDGFRGSGTQFLVEPGSQQQPRAGTNKGISFDTSGNPTTALDPKVAKRTRLSTSPSREEVLKILSLDKRFGNLRRSDRMALEAYVKNQAKVSGYEQEQNRLGAQDTFNTYDDLLDAVGGHLGN